MTRAISAVVLVGHGAPPLDFPRDRVARLKALEARRRASGAEMGEEERALDNEIRAWPRDAANDPYQAGINLVAARLQAALGEATLVVAYNEFCAPSLEGAVQNLLAAGHHDITVAPIMLTPGGVHSEVEIPESLAALGATHPGLTLRYAWPFDLDRVAELLASHIRRF